MASIRSFKELRVWQNAMAAALRVFELTKKFPAEERYSMTDQLRRASRSVAANIAEAWRKRRYPAAFVCKLNDAEAEAAEVQTWIELGLRCKYLSSEMANDLDNVYEQILSQLVTMIERSDDWVVGSNRVASDSVSQRGRHDLSPRPRVSASPRQRTERA